MKFQAIICLFIIFLSTTSAHDNANIPEDPTRVQEWFDENVRPFEERRASLDSALVVAESNTKILRVRRDGKGDFTTINDAVLSIRGGNTHRVIIAIGPGTYTEKIFIDKSKPFVTLYGEPDNMPTLVFNGTAAQNGTKNSATLMVKSDYFTAVNLLLKNSAPRPKKKDGDQAVALTIQGERAAFYNCRFFGFQDTLCDDNLAHFYKGCYIEGTVDFIFGNGKSIFLCCLYHGTRKERTLSRHRIRIRTLHHITGMRGVAYLGRPWKSYAKVVFAYSYLSEAIKPEGWSLDSDSGNNQTVYFGEYHNTGPSANFQKRAPYVKNLSDIDIEPFIKLGFIVGSRWLLPPPVLRNQII